MMPQSTAPSRHVFVYGTLRRGGDNDITRLTPSPLWVGPASVKGVMYHFGHYPGVLLGGAGDIVGEVYSITSTLEVKLDEIEELYPQQTNEYFKRLVSVTVAGAPLECIVYEINAERVAGRPIIASGDWVRHR